MYICICIYVYVYINIYIEYLSTYIQNVCNAKKMTMKKSSITNDQT